MTVLSIGNSFSQDAQQYLRGIARSVKYDIHNTNLMIGGCTLDRHFRNAMGDKKDYMLEVGGQWSDFTVTLKEALLARPWDVVTVQQASHESYREASYYPYIQNLVKYVHELCPNAKIYVHMTWGYQSNTDRIRAHGFETYSEMFAKVRECYLKAAKTIGADGILYSGEVIEGLLSEGVDPAKVHRDGFHLGLGLSRYAVGLLWFATLTGKPIDDVSFNDFDVPVTDEEIAIAKKVVGNVLAAHKGE